jgi:hypothetical protein
MEIDLDFLKEIHWDFRLGKQMAILMAICLERQTEKQKPTETTMVIPKDLHSDYQQAM